MLKKIKKRFFHQLVHTELKTIKNNLVEVLSGDNETIIGFPIKNLLEKLE